MSVKPTGDNAPKPAVEPASGDLAVAALDQSDDGLSWAPDPSLTLKPSRIAGSARCLNCGTPLAGPFCHYCGQPDRNFMRFFPALLREFVSESLEIDSRFARTLKALLFLPGRLSRDYLDGRRYRYTPPVRLYLFSSIVFFILAAFLSSDSFTDNVRISDQAQSGIQIRADSEEDLARIEEALSAFPEELRGQVDLGLNEASQQERDEQEFFEEGEIQFNDRPWHPEDNPVAIGWLPDSMNDWINEEISASPEKARRINEDPQLIFREMLDILPATMFVLLPVVALIFKFWYLFSGRYYIEHLILALHNHSFVYVILMIAAFLEALETLFAARGLGFLEASAYGLSYVAALWIPIYLVLSLKTVYQQGWLMTLAKGFVIGMSYLMLLVFVTALVALLSFILV
ncbi:MAG: DUF3667 domain-containing protein [Pseudomonadota bacterium]